MQITEAEYKLEAPDRAPTGLITVTGAQITADIVQSELARITRSDWRGRLYHMARILSWLRSRMMKRCKAWSTSDII